MTISGAGAVVRAAGVACVVMCAGVSTAQFAFHAEGPAASWGKEADPVGFKAAAEDRRKAFQSEDVEAVIDMPPLHEIPPMPMPSGEGAPVATEPGVALYHDMETGEVYELPATIYRGGGEGFGGATFEGLPDGLVQDNDPLKWGGTLSLQSDAARESLPQRYNAKLAMKFTDVNGVTRWFVCSGALNDAGVVVTSAHCIYARDCDGTCNIFDWAEEVWVFPGWDGVGDSTLDLGTSDDEFAYENFGVARAQGFVAYTSWTQNGSYEFEVASGRLSRTAATGGRQVGMLTGWYGWSYGGDCTDYTWHNYSYPSEDCDGGGPLHNGRDMYYWFGVPDSCPGNYIRLNTAGGCLRAGWGGMSGSNMYRIENGDRFTGAVSSTSNRSTRASYARLWEDFVVDTLQPMETSQRGTQVDYETFRFRFANGAVNPSVKAGTTFPATNMIVSNATNANPPPTDFVVDVYLSTNANISTGDERIATWNYSGVDFAAMQNITFNMPTFTLPADTAPGTYWLGAVLRTVSGEVTSANNETDTWDATRVTVTLGNPAEATLVSPANFATNVSEFADLDWSPAARATSYNVYFGTDSTPDSGEFLGSTTSTFRSLGTLSLGTTYYWRIDPRNSAGTTTGDVWRFTTRPAIFDISAVAIDADSGTFAAGQSNRYQLQIRNDGDIASPTTTVSVRASTNTIISTADQQVASFSVGAIQPGSVFNSGVRTFTIPASLANGDYYLGMILTTTGDNSTANNTAVDRDTFRVFTCPIDLTGDGRVNIFDIIEFFNLFSAQDRRADLANSDGRPVPDGVWDIFDIIAFFDAFSAGC